MLALDIYTGSDRPIAVSVCCACCYSVTKSSVTSISRKLFLTLGEDLDGLEKVTRSNP